MDAPSSIATRHFSIKVKGRVHEFRAVDEHTADLLSTTNHVNLDVQEARRLGRSTTMLMSASERVWMNQIIENTQDALQAVVQLIEPAQVDEVTERGRSIGTSVTWGLRDNANIRYKHGRLAMCHQSLTTVISCLYSKTTNVITPMIEGPENELPPTISDPQIQDLLEWQNQRKRKKSRLSPRGDENLKRPASNGSISTTTPSITSNDTSSILSTSTLPPELDNQPCYSSDDRPIWQSTSRSNDIPRIELPDSGLRRDALDPYKHINSSNIVAVQDIDLMNDYIKSTSSISELEGCAVDIPAYHQHPYFGSDGLQIAETYKLDTKYPAVNRYAKPMESGLATPIPSRFATALASAAAASSSTQSPYEYSTPNISYISSNNNMELNTMASSTEGRSASFSVPGGGPAPGRYIAYHPSLQHIVNINPEGRDTLNTGRISVRRRKWNSLADHETQYRSRSESA